jgi:hypothetical protein
MWFDPAQLTSIKRIQVLSGCGNMGRGKAMTISGAHGWDDFSFRFYVCRECSASLCGLPHRNSRSPGNFCPLLYAGS